MTTFKSLVILDLETSGLPSDGPRTKITELSFLGVLVNHVLESHKRNEGTPRVLQKLSLCVYPQKMIDFEATEMTGLDNFLLEELPPFNQEAIQMLSSFLQRMPPPLCLVAHNGMKFDFPLLKAELSAKNEVLPGQISCADSLLAFRSLFPVTSRMCSSSSSITAIPPSLVCPPRAVTTAGDAFSHATANLPSIEDYKKSNETTPKQAKRPGFVPPLKRKNLLQNDENTDYQNGAVRKKLFKGRDKPDSHKLVDLYRHICGQEQDNGHRAESDSLILLECIVATAPEFLVWIENNHLNFGKIPCMW